MSMLKNFFIRLCPLFSTLNSFHGWRIFGFFLLTLGIMGGGFFLIQFLTPKIGFVESGCCVSMLLILSGCALLFFTREKKVSLIDVSPFYDTVPVHLRNIFESLHLEKTLENNITKIALFAVGIGIALSQLKNTKKYFSRDR